jgi:hypothetical protein
MSSSSVTSAAKIHVTTDESFWVSPGKTERQVAAGDPVPESYFTHNGTGGRIRFVRLDENTFVHPKIDGSPAMPPTDDSEGWRRLQRVGWRANPSEIRPGNSSHPIRSDPGRIAETAGLLPNASGNSVPALPTHHFATPWMLQKLSLHPGASIIDEYRTAAVRDTPLNPPTICTGPFVCRLEPDPRGNACMKLLITVEYEAGAELLEEAGSSSVKYTSANNGACFLANEGEPWTVYDITSMTIVMQSSGGSDRGKSNRFVHISRGLMSVMYIGDAPGIVKNFAVPTTTDVAAGLPPSRGNISNQFGYGSVGLGAPRTFTKVWDTSLCGEAPTNNYESFHADPAVVNEFLRLSGSNNVLDSTHKIYAKHEVANADLIAHVASTGGPPAPNLDLTLVVALGASGAPVNIPSVTDAQVLTFTQAVDLGAPKGATLIQDISLPIVNRTGANASPAANHRVVYAGDTVEIFGRNMDIFGLTPSGGAVVNMSMTPVQIYFHTDDAQSTQVGPTLTVIQADLFVTETSVSFVMPVSVDMTSAQSVNISLTYNDGVTTTLFSMDDLNGGSAGAQIGGASVPKLAPRILYDHTVVAVPVIYGKSVSHLADSTGVGVVFEVYGRNLGGIATTVTNAPPNTPAFTAAGVTIAGANTTVRFPAIGAGVSDLPRDGTVMQVEFDMPIVLNSTMLSGAYFTGATIPGDTVFVLGAGNSPSGAHALTPAAGQYYTGTATPGDLVVYHGDAVTFAGTFDETTIGGRMRLHNYLNGASSVVDRAAAASVSGVGGVELTTAIPSNTYHGAVYYEAFTDSYGEAMAVGSETLADTNTYRTGAMIRGHYGTRPNVQHVPDMLKLDLTDAFDSSDDFTAKITPAVRAAMTTYYIASAEDIAAATGGTPDEIAQNTVPTSVISLYANFASGPLELDDGNPATAQSGTQPRVSVTVGNVWLPQNTGQFNEAVRPVGMAFLGHTVPNFPDTGIPVHSAVADEYVASFPVDRYGSQVTSLPNGSAIRALLGAKYLTHDFEDTTLDGVRVNFRARQNDVFPKGGNQTDANSQKALLFWEPIFNAKQPAMVTITRPSGFRIVKFEIQASATTSTANTGDYVFTRQVGVPSNMQETSLYTRQKGATVGHKAVGDIGDPIVSVDEAIAILDTLDREFSQDTSGASVNGAAPLTNATNDCLMWKGYPVWRGQTEESKFRIRARPLDWGRKIYRYARYIEMASRGAADSYANFIDSAGNDQSTAVATRVVDAATKIWRGVRQALTNGFMPEWDILNEVLRSPGLVSTNINGVERQISGFDIAYNGHNPASVSRPADSTTAITQMLAGLGYTKAEIRRARIVTYFVDGVAAPLVSNLGTLAQMTDAGVAAAVLAEAANTAVAATDQLFAVDFQRIVAQAKLSIREATFVEDALTTFNQLRYDRAMCEDPRSARSVWGGLTSRFNHELWRWAMVVHPDDPTDPYTDAAAYPGATDAVRVVQLSNVLQSDDPRDVDLRFHEPSGFSYYNDHHVTYGYMLYASYIALRYAKTATSTFPGHGSHVLIGEDIASMLTSESASKSAARATRPAHRGDIMVCNEPEPFPLAMMLSDFVGAACETDIRVDRSENVFGMRRRCRGARAPRSNDGVDRWFPPHRHFDAYLGHSFATGPAVPYRGQTHEATSEAIVGYLGAYRFLAEFSKFALSQTATEDTPAKWLPSLVGYLYRPARNGYFPQTAFAVLAQELASAGLFRALRHITGTATAALAQTASSGGVARGGYPVVRSERFNQAYLAKFVTSACNTGVARGSASEFDQKAYRKFPMAMLLNLGAQLVPICDLTSSINPHTWVTHVTAASEIVGTAARPAANPATFGGSLFTPVGTDLPLTVGEWLDYLLTDCRLNSRGERDPDAPVPAPSLGVQGWARMLAAGLNYAPIAANGGAAGAVAFPGPLPTAAAPTPQRANLALRYPGPLTVSDYYLPQSSWYDVLTWFRHTAFDRGEPVPGVPDPFPLPP